jgi:hypothetical protein
VAIWFRCVLVYPLGFDVFFFCICSNALLGFDVFSAPECLVSLMENMELIPGPDTSSLTDFRMVIPALPKLLPSEEIDKDLATNPVPLVAVRRPDSGGKEGALIQLLANHFLVQFEPSQQIFHYDVDIFPQPSKEVARHLKRKLVE